METKDITFSQAQQQIESIVQQIENNEIDLETLTKKLKEAKELIKICETKLRTIEDEIQ